MKLYDRLIILQAKLVIMELRIEEKELIQRKEDRALLASVFGATAA